VVVESPETKEPVEVQSEATKILESVPQCSHPEKKVEAVEVVSEEIILPTAGSSLCDTPPAVMEVTKAAVADVTKESPLDVPIENPPLRPKKSDLDEFEDFLETIDKDLIGDISPQSLSVARPNGNPGVGLEGEPNTAEKKSSEPLLQENKELKKQVHLPPLPSLTFSAPQVHSLRKIFHDKTLRFNQLQRELTSLRLTLQPQSKHQANRSTSLFHVNHEENTDEFLSKFDEFQKSSSRHSRRNQGGGIFDDHSEPPVHRSFRKSEQVDELESNLFCVPSDDFEEEDASSPELNSRLKEEVPCLLSLRMLTPPAGRLLHSEHL
jgi:hypothetical protein